MVSVPARAERDELAAIMLAQLLGQEGIAVEVASAEMTAGELIEWTVKLNPGVISISVVPPTTIVHARYLCVKLRARLPEAIIVIGLWGEAERVDEAVRRLRASGADEVVQSLVEGVARFKKMAGKATDDEAAEEAKAVIPTESPTALSVA